VDLLSAEFRVNPPECKAGIESLLAELKAEELVEFHLSPYAGEAHW
jgi:hypothetical protein